MVDMMLVEPVFDGPWDSEFEHGIVVTTDGQVYTTLVHKWLTQPRVRHESIPFTERDREDD